MFVIFLENYIIRIQYYSSNDHKSAKIAKNRAKITYNDIIIERLRDLMNNTLKYRFHSIKLVQK